MIAGEVLLDGENIKKLKVEWVRSQIGLVSQEPALFKGTIKENICYGREASEDEIEEAAKIAHAHTFISSLSEGYESQVLNHASAPITLNLSTWFRCDWKVYVELLVLSMAKVYPDQVTY